MYKYAYACQVVRGCIVVLIFQPCWFSIISRNQLKSPLLSLSLMRMNIIFLR